MKKKILSNLNRKSKNILKIILENKLVSLLVLFLLIGMTTGSICAKFSDDNFIDNLDFLFASNFKIRAEQAMTDTFIASFTSSFVFTAILILMGLSAWGIFFIPFIPFFRGFGLGLIAGFLYSNYGLKGIIFHILVLLPGVFISSIGIIIESKESISLSAKIISQLSPHTILTNKWKNFKIYFMRSGFVFIILAIASFIDMIFNELFAGLFKF